MHDFHGWDASGLWEDVNLDLKYFNQIERLAIFGNKAWEQRMAEFCRPFTTAKIQNFDHSKTAEALHWIYEGIASTI